MGARYCPLCTRRGSRYNTAIQQRDFEPIAQLLCCACPAKIAPSDDTRWMYAPCGYSKKQAHHDVLQVSVDGACSDNGYLYSKSGIGVFFGFGNKLNRSASFEDHGHTPTSQRAELMAAIACIERVQSAWNCSHLGPQSRGGRPSMVVVRTDSAYVVGGMLDWIHKWRNNGWRNARGQRVANTDLWMRLYATINKLEADTGIDVAFYKVPREYNQSADALAKAALS